MSDSPNGTNTGRPTTEPPLRGRRALLDKYPWVTFLLPFLVFSLITALEPTPNDTADQAAGPAISYNVYPLVYTAKIALTIAAICFVLPGYRAFPLRVSPLAVVVGVVGIVVWIGLYHLQLEQKTLPRLGLGRFVDMGARSAYDPLEQLAAQPALAWGFLAVRFLGLAAVVPIVEEFFLRGLLMRFVVAPDWWKLPIGRVNTTAILIGTLIYPALSHPGELLAAVVWFSMVTWLMVKTRSIWDCVAAHAITNLLLGIYVVATGEWPLM